MTNCGGVFYTKPCRRHLTWTDIPEAKAASATAFIHYW